MEDIDFPVLSAATGRAPSTIAPAMKSLVCLISGRGSNLEAILRAQAEQNWEEKFGARVAAVISNRAQAGGLSIAAAHGVSTHVLAHDAYEAREDFEAALGQLIERYEPTLVVLAGFMRVLTAQFVAEYHGRLINIHPSLLPAFSGLHTHRRALDAGVRVHGATVHFVSSQLDGGPIIAQAALAVEPGESETQLAARVLALEHVLLPSCIAWILAGKVRLQGQRVRTEGLGAADLLTFAR